MAKKMVVMGLHRAYVRMYRAAVSARLSSAPMNRARGSAAKNITVPITSAAIKISRIEQEKILLAVFSSFLPSAMDMGTEEPTPTRSDREKLIRITGKAILTAAKAASPSFWPMNMPSRMV